jgi:DNA-binding IclR family transcriptional regulator
MDAGLKRILADHLAEQANTMRASAHVAILDAENMVRFIAQAEPTGGTTISGRIGSTHEAYFMAVGKVLLSGLRRSRLTSYLLSGPFIAVTRNTITNPQQLADELARIRIEGYAIDDEEFMEDMRSIAVPLRDEAGEVIAALSLSAARSVLSPSRTQVIADALKADASRLSERLRELPWGARTLLCRSSDYDGDALGADTKIWQERAMC